MLCAGCSDRGAKAHKELHFTEAEDWRAMASGHTVQHRALVAVERALEAIRHGVWMCTGRAEGTRKRLVHVVEAVEAHRDTNDTKSIASDIGTIRKGRMVA
jgi:hypothetical protein